MRNNILFLLVFISFPSYAERADRNKPINIEADQVLVDDAKQTSTFTGKVVLIQGTMVIHGDKVVVVEDKQGYKQGTAYGHTASFRQKREGLDEYVEGYGERIVYDTRLDTVDFYVQARVKRAQDEVRGEHITYNSKTEIFQADDKGAASNTGAPKRVHAVLHAKPKSGEEADVPKTVNPIPAAGAQ
ncbi:MAG: lipopolysaccharide transport periplasmic protein LptA [Gallionellales bacterium RIFOXYB12_FULL_54_9]|nr:MAG: lipopolysaccharide transport periplasmic protein LptA [Gallionellales bacterium RIFOXYB12_FULL_54_9]